MPLRAPTLRYEIFVAWRARRQLAPAAHAVRTALLSPSDVSELARAAHSSVR
jgi:hypothetical protein